MINKVYNGLCFIVSFFVSLIISYYLGTLLLKICPLSEIPLRNEHEYKIEFDISDDKKPFRKFNVFDQNILEEIDELIQLNFKETFKLVKDFKCKLTEISNDCTFKPKTLIIIPKNDIHWSDGIYFSVDNRTYFPEQNSILYHPNEVITFKSNKNKSFKAIIGLS